MYFWLNYFDENHVQRILIVGKNINRLFHLASEKIEADRVHMFLVSDGSRIDENECLSSLENGIELIVWTEKYIKKLSFYFELKRYLSLKNISYPLKHWFFFMTLGWY